MNRNFPLSKANVAGLFLVMTALYFCSCHDYLLFHSLTEIFSFVIAFGIFLIAWNSRHIQKNHYLLFLGIAYLFVGSLDMAHTLFYKGMMILHNQDANIPTQLWTIARYTESLSLLIAPVFLTRSINPIRTLIIYLVLTAALLWSVFTGIFPTCYVEGVGLTFFKKLSEYIICVILTGAFGMLWINRQRFSPAIFNLLGASVILTICSELAFTAYISVSGIPNIVGHFLKFVSFYLIYKALVETGLKDPFELLFRDLKESEKKYRSLFAHMLNGFAYHQIILDNKGNPVDYIFLEVNDAFEQMTGLKGEDVIGKKVTDVIPGIRDDGFDWIGEYANVALNRTTLNTEQYSPEFHRWYSISAYSPEPGYFAVIFEDISQRRIADQSLKEREWQFKSTFDNAAVGIAHVSLQGHFLLVNDKLCEIVGYSRSELHKKNFQEISFADDLVADLAQAERLTAGEMANYSLEKRYYHHDGHLVWVNLTVSLQKDDEGNPLYFIAVVEDISQRKLFENALRESEEKFLLMANSIRDVIWMSSPDGKEILYINPAYNKIWGRGIEDLYDRKRNFSDDIHPQDRDSIRTMRRKNPLDKWESVHRIIRPDGSIRWIEDSSTPITNPEGDEHLRVGIARDITERKRAELEREDYLAQLNILMQELERSNQDLQQFANIISHDLQEPLRTISSFIQLLANRYQGQLDDKADQYIDFILDGTGHMKNLLQDLLAFARLGGGQLRLQPLDLHSILDTVLQSLATKISENQAEIRWRDLPEVFADETQIQHLFQNLVANGIKFRGKENPVLKIGAERRNGEWIISVKDNGIGINPKYADRIFIIFQRLHRRGEYEGTGMGLAICKKIVERHKGRIWVESEPGKGANFYFSLPGN